MHYKENEKQTLSLQVTDGLTVTILPDSSHEFLMPTKEVAYGYGTSDKSIRELKQYHKEELKEGKHFIMRARFSGAGMNNTSTFWTKRGIVRLGFFIKSERAHLFRDWAEDLVINKIEQKKPAALQANYQTRLEFKNLLEIVDSAAILCGSHARLAGRLGIAATNFTHIVKHPWLVSDEMQNAIEKGCRNIIANNNQVDIEALEALVMVANPKARLTLFNKMKKGGLI